MQVKEAFTCMGWQSTLLLKPRTPVWLSGVNAKVYDSGLTWIDVQRWQETRDRRCGYPCSQAEQPVLQLCKCAGRRSISDALG